MTILLWALCIGRQEGTKQINSHDEKTYETTSEKEETECRLGDLIIILSRICIVVLTNYL